MGNQKHVIYGSGPLGAAVMRALRKRAYPIQIINRSGERSADIPDDVEIIAGNAFDVQFNREVLVGTEVVYQCAQPPYHQWADKFRSLQDAILEGAAANGAKLIAGENLYMYGDTDGKTLKEDLPYCAHTRKGRVRGEMAEALLTAHRDGKVKVAMARGSDFYGPGVLSSAVGERVFASAIQGKSAQFMGDLDQPHTFTYIDDFGEAMVTLGEREEALGQAWHVPNDRPEISQREFGKMIFQELGKPAKLSRMGRMMLWIGGLFIHEARESAEMLYEFEKPFVVDSSKFKQAFALQPTPIQEGIRRTIEWYRSYLADR